MRVVEFKHDFGPLTWTQVRNYTHVKPLANGTAVGNGWKTRHLPRILKTSDGYTMRSSTGERVAYRYDESTGDFSCKKYHEEKLILDETKNEFRAQRKNGDIWFFNRTESEQYPEGTLKRIDGVDGQAVLFVYENKRITLIQGFEKASDASPTSTISFSCEANGLFSEIVLRLADERKTLRNFTKIIYTHYGENESHGNPGDLKTAVRHVAEGDAWKESGTWYYRYFKDGDTRGHRFGMKSAFLPQEFETLKTVKGNEFISLADEELASFASFEFEYDAEQRKTLERSARGTLTKTWNYETFAGPGWMNHVRTRTTEIRSDGKKTDVFKNRYGKVIFKEELDETIDGFEPIRVLNVFDRGGNVLRKYLPGSIRSWWLTDHAKGKKIAIVSAQNEGQIVYNTFDSHARNARKISLAIQNGTKGKSIPQGRWEYEAFDVAGKSVVKLRKRVVFADENGQNKIETAYQHELYGLSGKIRKKTAFLPTVSQLENGDGQQTQTVEIMNEYGRTVWSMDESGVISHSVYDELTGKLIRRIEDVDTTKTGDFGTSLPPGWQTPEEAGKHNITDYAYDFKGRLIQTTRPENEGIDDYGKLVCCRPVSWTIYDDATRTRRSASGYLELDNEGNIVKTVFVNPVSITIHNADGNITDQIQASRKKLDGPLTKKDHFEQDSYLSWTKNIFRFGKLVAMRQYHVIPECGEGISGDCYAETTYDYDLQGRQVRTVSPSGAINRTVYDSRDNAIQSWIGTNDTGATDTNPKNDDPANDMHLVAETVYGRGSDCASCNGGAGDRVLAQVQHLDQGKSRVTEYKYDWRGRQTETLSDEDENGNSIASVQYYDNLDRVIKTEQYLHQEDKKTKRHEQRLLSRTQMFLNARGQAWKTVQSIIEKKSKQS